MALSIVSLNCKGFNRTCDYIKDIVSEKEPLFIFLQETWHLSSNASVLSNVSDSYLYKETSGVDSSARILAGRPHGGLAIFFQRSIADKITHISTDNRRICAIKFETGGYAPLLLINVYMPCDTQSVNSVNPIFVDTISDIELLMSEHSGDVCLAGDWNTDPARQTAQTVCFNNFIDRNGLTLGWQHANARAGDTYVSDINNATSCIDHFVLSSNLFESITACNVNTNPLNPSDHRDIWLQANYSPITCHVNADLPFNKNGISWRKTSDENICNYKHAIDVALESICVDYEVFSCSDPLCADPAHRKAINDICNDLINVCLEAGDSSFPKTSPPRGHIPKWNSDIKPLREDSLFWHSLWVDSGRPPVGALASIMRNTRSKYHRAVKSHKRNMENHRRSMMAQSVANGQQRDLWTELKKFDRNKRLSPSSINGCSDNTEIADIFANKYRDLYTSVPTSKPELDQIRNHMRSEISAAPQLDSVNISVENVCKAISKLNLNKRDGSRGTNSNHFIHCSHKMKVLITLMINSMFNHGFTPNDLLESVVTSIPKDLRGNLCTDDNYRGIALCSALCKVIDILIIDKYSEKLLTSELQFSFKSEHSTNMCTSIFKEVCSYYKARNTDVFVCLLDASKAFDRVHYGKLFELLNKRKVPVIVRRLLLDMYTRQHIQATWNGSLSEAFTVENGVKQGGILSPILFCVYMDELLNRINNSGLGCHIGHKSYSGLGYADDVTVLTPSVKALQMILHICEDFALEYNVLFNCKKTICMRVGSGGKPPDRSVTLNGSNLIWNRKVKHLGNVVTCDLSDADDITFKKGVFISQVNKMNVKFSSVHSTLKGQLLQTYCCSFYGCQTWDLTGRSVRCMGTEWNKAVRRTLSIPYKTRTNILPHLVVGKSFVDQHKSRVSNFLDSFIHSRNTHVSYIGARARWYSHGPLGRNFTRCQADVSVAEPVADLLVRSQAIRELIDVRDGISELPGLTHEEIQSVIESLCVL